MSGFVLKCVSCCYLDFLYFVSWKYPALGSWNASSSLPFIIANFCFINLKCKFLQSWANSYNQLFISTPVSDVRVIFNTSGWVRKKKWDSRDHQKFCSKTGLFCCFFKNACILLLIVGYLQHWHNTNCVFIIIELYMIETSFLSKVSDLYSIQISPEL